MRAFESGQGVKYVWNLWLFICGLLLAKIAFQLNNVIGMECLSGLLTAPLLGGSIYCLGRVWSRAQANTLQTVC